MQNSHNNDPERIEGQETESKQPLDSYNASMMQQIRARLEELELENLKLKHRPANLSRMGMMPISISLLGVGSAILIFSYLLSSSILTFIGLGIVFWGILIIYISPSRQVRADLLNSISSSMQKSIDDLVSYLGYTGEVIFFHPKSLTGLGQGYVFITHYANKSDENLKTKLDNLDLLPYSTGTNIPTVYLDPRGIFLIAPGQGLVDLFEKELAVNLATVNMSYIQEELPKLLIEDLKIVEDMSIELHDNASTIIITFGGGPCSDICYSLNKRGAKLGDNLGCMICSAMALVFSKVTRKPVIIKETKAADASSISTTFSLVNQ